jgi:hypothetical protein
MLLGASFTAFLDDFRKLYNIKKTDEFEVEWTAFMNKYPTSQPYMNKHIYSRKTMWCSAWYTISIT